MHMTFTPIEVNFKDFDLSGKLLIGSLTLSQLGTKRFEQIY